MGSDIVTLCLSHHQADSNYGGRTNSQAADDERNVSILISHEYENTQRAP
jgi:hypothetical protein